MVSVCDKNLKIKEKAFIKSKTALIWIELEQKVVRFWKLRGKILESEND